MTKQLKIQNIKMEQEGLKYRCHPERKRAVGEEGGGGVEGNGGNVQLEAKMPCSSAGR